MAICNVVDDRDRSAEEHERITHHLRGSGPVPPEGCLLVLVSRQRTITVWNTHADLDRFFAQRLTPAYHAVGRSLDEITRTQFDVDILVADELAASSTSPSW